MKPQEPTLTPLSALRVSRHHIPSHALIPNSTPTNRPLYIYHAALPNANASDIESRINFVGVVAPQWRYTMYPTTHFHSTTHEVLCVSAGRARLCFGGELNPGRVEPVVEKGDVMVVPAGVGHRLLEDYGGFEMVGSYPKDAKGWDMCYGKEDEREKIETIKELDWFEMDPLYGSEGPVLS